MPENDVQNENPLLLGKFPLYPLDKNATYVNVREGSRERMGVQKENETADGYSSVLRTTDQTFILDAEGEGPLLTSHQEATRRLKMNQDSPSLRTQPSRVGTKTRS